jgi:hypothetical protein
MKYSLYIAGTLAAMTTIASSQNANDAYTAQAGTHIGRVFIGDTRAAVGRRLGPPTRTLNLGRSLVSQVWRSKRVGDTGTYNTVEVVYRGGIVSQIEATSLAFKTPGGLSLASKRASWERAYGTPSVSTYSYATGKYLRKRYLDWKSRGIALELVEEGGDTEASPTSWVYQTLIVHRRGVSVLADLGGTPQ